MIDRAAYLRFRPAFAQIIDPRRYSIDWLDRRIAGADAQFWHCETAAIVTELRGYPTGACDIHGLIAAGDRATIVGRLIPAAEAWGRGQGCLAAIIESRAGWGRVLKDHGYAPYQLALRKDFA